MQRLGLPQFSLLGESIRVVKEKPVNLGATSSFGALMVSTASRVGTGNIMGVSLAICSGGPGAIFWMWVTAILGGASAFVESTLAQIYYRVLAVNPHDMKKPTRIACGFLLSSDARTCVRMKYC